MYALLCSDYLCCNNVPTMRSERDDSLGFNPHAPCEKPEYIGFAQAFYIGTKGTESTLQALSSKIANESHTSAITVPSSPNPLTLCVVSTTM